jgi:pimeloyl-ACP methyl ester carboxylesterase
VLSFVLSISICDKVKMTEQYIDVKGIRIAYDQFGDVSHPAIVLIMGLGTQMISWPEIFCQGLADKGYRVLRFDNRDIGLSSKMHDAKIPGLMKIILYAKLGLTAQVPYKLIDMANDAVGLMDGLNIEKAHIIGASMGGMIAQLMAAHYPQRTLSLTSIMSTSGRRSLPGPSIKILWQMAKRSATNEEAHLDNAMQLWALIGSPNYLPAPQELRERIRINYRRSYYPPGYIRQVAAIAASGDRVELLKKITAPTLIIHGLADPLVPAKCGIDTAELIPNAQLELIDGMGHDLPQPLLPKFIDLINSYALNPAH